jgi:putative ABC transport system permease protein
LAAGSERGDALSSWLFDIRGAISLARRQRMFTVLMVAVLGIGIGAAVAMFSVLEAVVLRPLPYGRPAELMWLTSLRPDGSQGPFSIQDFVDLRERDTGCGTIGAFATWSANLTGDGIPERLQGMRASGNAFDVLQVRPLIGRTFRGDDRADDRAILLGHRLWMRRFGGSPAILGHAITLNSAVYTVVGVLPESFVFPIREAELVVPLVEEEARRVEGDVNSLRLIGRLRQAVSREQAEQALTARAQELRRLRPATNARKIAIRATNLHAQIVGDYAAALQLLFGAVVLVLLLACVNLATLTLARTIGRRQEFAIRTALGVSQTRLALQLLVESLVPALVAGCVGLMLAAAATRAVLAVAPAAMPRASSVSLDLRVVAVAFGMAILSGIVVGLAPALNLSRILPAAGLQAIGRASAGPNSLALRRGLVATEVAISLVLAVTTALLVESFRRIQQVDPGFATNHTLSMRLSLSRERYPDRASMLAFQRRLEDQLRALPGVTSVGGTSLLPLSGLRASVDFAVEGRAVRRDEVPEAEYRVASPDYFATMNIRLLKGRAFTERDVAPAVNVAIVNQTLASRMWPGENPIGRRLRIEPENPFDDIVEVVGVVGDVKHIGLDGQPTMDLYVPFAQLPERSVVWVTNNQFWVVHTDANPRALVAAARAALSAADPDVPAASVRTLENAIDNSLAVRRFNLWLAAAFGYAALVLTACGIYAVSAHAVTERVHELGIRAALGASPRRLVSLVLRTDFTCVVLGIGAGLIASRAIAPILRGLLFEVRPSDPGVYVLVAVMLAAVGVAACGIPAVRAARTDPARALRH